MEPLPYRRSVEPPRTVKRHWFRECRDPSNCCFQPARALALSGGHLFGHLRPVTASVAKWSRGREIPRAISRKGSPQEFWACSRLSGSSSEAGFWEINDRWRRWPPGNACLPRRDSSKDRRPGRQRYPSLERLREPSLQELTQLRRGPELRNRLQFLECRGKRV
jgi:hypothetical protein